MERGELYKTLENDFAATFIRELIPGVLHNFANPLNGIMGRSKLLQRRIDDVVKKIEEQHPAVYAAMENELQRIKNDIRSISKESDSFFEMFRDASGKFYALANRGDDRINLSQLLAAEMRFANFYLEFKHEIKKDAHFDPEVPDIRGNLAELTLTFWRVVRFAMLRALAAENKEFVIQTKYDDMHVVVVMKHTGESIDAREAALLEQYLLGKVADLTSSKLEKGFLTAFEVLKKYSATLTWGSDDVFKTLALRIPYRAAKA